MIDAESYRQYAADCMRQAQDENSADDKTLILNVALAWLRLARQTESMAAESALVMSEQAASAQPSMAL